MNWGLNPFALESSGPSVGHWKGIPMTTGTLRPEEVDGAAGKMEPLATIVTDGGLVIKAGADPVTKVAAGAVPRAETAEFAVWLRPDIELTV